MIQDKTSLISSLFQEKPWYQSEKKSITSFLLITSADMFQHLPPWVARTFFRWIDQIGLFLIRILKIIPFNTQAYHHIKIKKQNEQKITILYQGNLPTFMHFLKTICPDKENRTIKIITKDKRNKKKVEEIKKQVDMIILEKDYFFRGFYQKRNYFIIPENISYLLSTHSPIDQILSNFSIDIQKDIRKAESYGYHYIVSDKMADFSMFYNKMYLPYITWKHNDVKKIISYHAMKHYFLRGANILFLSLKDKPIFGGIFEVQKEKIMTHYAGIKQGEYSHIQNGIVALSYYSLLKIAKEKNLKSINFGTSPPFLLDGLCKYKMKWNLKIEKSNPSFSTIFAIKMNNTSKNVSRLFKNNPFIYFKNDKLSIAYFIGEFENETIKNKEIVNHNHLKGIEPTLFHSLTDL